MAKSKLLLLRPDVALSLPCWMSQFSFFKLKQPTGQRQSNVRKQQNKILIRPTLFLYYEESLVSPSLISNLLRFHCAHAILHTKIDICTSSSTNVYFKNLRLCNAKTFRDIPNVWELHRKFLGSKERTSFLPLLWKLFWWNDKQFQLSVHDFTLWGQSLFALLTRINPCWFSLVFWNIH